jgi:hypothetical protein
VINLEKYTTEEVMLMSFRESPSTIEAVLRAQPGTSVNMTLTIRFDVPAVYAKAILLDYMKTELEK